MQAPRQTLFTTARLAVYSTAIIYNQNSDISNYPINRHHVENYISRPQVFCKNLSCQNIQNVFICCFLFHYHILSFPQYLILLSNVTSVITRCSIAWTPSSRVCKIIFLLPPYSTKIEKYFKTKVWTNKLNLSCNRKHSRLSLFV